MGENLKPLVDEKIVGKFIDTALTLGAGLLEKAETDNAAHILRILKDLSPYVGNGVGMVSQATARERNTIVEKKMAQLGYKKREEEDKRTGQVDQKGDPAQ
jgi:hypothetical protein